MKQHKHIWGWTATTKEWEIFKKKKCQNITWNQWNNRSNVSLDWLMKVLMKKLPGLMLLDYTWTKFVSTAYPCTIYTLKMNIRWGYRIFGKYSVFEKNRIFGFPNIPTQVVISTVYNFGGKGTWNDPPGTLKYRPSLASAMFFAQSQKMQKWVLYLVWTNILLLSQPSRRVKLILGLSESLRR